ncbi:MAG TPA: Si-specific NAD(P)(+) transhydrogenase [Candidatus Polarisedimenticolia bacterium]|nr:Si-specific NAD(P)(+) transhydrogenase [Candidatus Polarisedimenticolia bacterium]
MSSFDLCVIGTGPAGQRAAIQAAKLGKKVAICERLEMVGGVCINTGTIPSKSLREAILYLTGYLQRGVYGSSYTVKEGITMQDLLFRCEHVVRREIDVIRDQMRRNQVTLLQGAAAFLDPHRLAVTGSKGTTDVQAERVVIATGTVPSVPKDVQVDGETVLISDHILKMRSLPRTLTVVGAGVIGLEYASMFSALGVRVTLVDKRPRLLEFVDAEIIESLSYQMRNMKCTFRLGEEVASVTVEGPGRAVATLKSGKTIVSELLLYSVGRMGATGDLKLEAAGLKADAQGRLKVNAFYQTEQPHIYAVGDVIGFPSLASTSSEQGRLAASHAFGTACSSLPHLFPYGIYSIPEISFVGKNELELTEAGVPYEVGVARYKEIARGQILGDESGLLKILFHRMTRKVLGVHIIGTGATELVHIGQAVLAFDGTIDYFVQTVFNYPTFAECYKVAALDGFNKVGPARAESAPPDGAPARRAAG